MTDSPAPSPMDVLLYCERCRRVTAHYPSVAPPGDEVWICSECALIDVLIEVSSPAFSPREPVHS